MKSAAESPIDAPPSPRLSGSQLATLAGLGEERTAGVGDALYGVGDWSLLDGGPLGSAYAVEKLGEMRDHSYAAGFPVRLALPASSFRFRSLTARTSTCPY